MEFGMLVAICQLTNGRGGSVSNGINFDKYIRYVCQNVWFSLLKIQSLEARKVVHQRERERGLEQTQGDVTR